MSSCSACLRLAIQTQHSCNRLLSKSCGLLDCPMRYRSSWMARSCCEQQVRCCVVPASCAYTQCTLHLPNGHEFSILMSADLYGTAVRMYSTRSSVLCQGGTFLVQAMSSCPEICVPSHHTTQCCWTAVCGYTRDCSAWLVLMPTDTSQSCSGFRVGCEAQTPQQRSVVVRVTAFRSSSASGPRTADCIVGLGWQLQHFMAVNLMKCVHVCAAAAATVACLPRQPSLAAAMLCIQRVFNRRTAVRHLRRRPWCQFHRRLQRHGAGAWQYGTAWHA
jgi:hypothetical protein